MTMKVSFHRLTIDNSPCTWGVITCIALAALTGCSTIPKESPGQTMQTSQQFRKKITRTIQLDYLLHLPEGYDKGGTNQWPLMLFLHGAGERGNDLAKVAVHGPPKLVKTKKDFPFVLVSPQCPADQTWRDDELLALLDLVLFLVFRHLGRCYGIGCWL